MHILENMPKSFEPKSLAHLCGAHVYHFSENYILEMKLTLLYLLREGLMEELSRTTKRMMSGYTVIILRGTHTCMVNYNVPDTALYVITH